MPQRIVLARGLLFSCAALLFLAAPVLATLPPAAVDWVQHGDPTQSATGTPGNPGVAKLAALQPAILPQAATNVVISEFRSRGPAGASLPSADADEFIELYNPTATSITLTNWSMWRSDCAGATSLIPDLGALNITIPAGGHYLIGGLEYGGAITPDDALNDIGLDDDGGLALRSGPGASDPIVDQVGMCDSGGFVEIENLAPMASDLDQSYDRQAEIPGGICTDAGNNSLDFFLRTPSDPQSSTSGLTICGNPTPTASPTSTLTPTNTPVCNSVPVTPLLVLINEVAWYGTADDIQDYWIELYNTHPSCNVELDGWRLVGIRNGAQQFQVTFGTDDDLAPNGFMVIMSEAGTFNPELPGGVEVKVASSLILGSTGQSLQLLGPADVPLVDTANYSPTGNLGWPAGSTSQRRSMERYRYTADAPTNWVTFSRPLPFPSDWPRAEGGSNFIYGSPGMANWSLSVTTTPSPVATKARTPTPRPPTPFAHMLINEFLPRAGSDWNGDGTVNVYDEFIEIKNNGPIDGNLEGWKLDDAADLGSPAFTLPNIVLQPGERAVFYGLTTRILLEDSGDTVRLINPQGAVIDGRTYGITETLDVSHCRIPDGYYWRTACFSTPGNENALTGVAPVPAPIILGKPVPCLLPDTAPEPFVHAECEAYGDDMWDRTFWDEPEPVTLIVEGTHAKWKTSIE